MTRRPTFRELAWPDDSDDANLPVQWAQSVSTQILDWIWRAYDALRSKHLSRIDLTQPLEQLERDLVSQHYIEIVLLFATETGGYSSLVPHHEWPEMETRSSASAKPPAYDVAFVSVTDRRWAWPIEAKMIPGANALAEYLKDVNQKFVTGIAGPLVGEGAMLGYLLCSNGSAVVANLETRLGQDLRAVSDFPKRLHRTSRHPRATAPVLRLHHLLMVCVE